MTAFRWENTALKQRERERERDFETVSERGGKEGGKGAQKIKTWKRVEGGMDGGGSSLGRDGEDTLKM